MTSRRASRSKESHSAPNPAATDVWLVDRVEGDKVVIEVGDETLTLPAWLLPADVEEDAVYRVAVDRGKGQSVVKVVADEAERERRLKRSRAQSEVKSSNDTPGDIKL